MGSAKEKTESTCSLLIRSGSPPLLVRRENVIKSESPELSSLSRLSGSSAKKSVIKTLDGPKSPSRMIPGKEALAGAQEPGAFRRLPSGRIPTQRLPMEGGALPSESTAKIVRERAESHLAV